MAGALHYLPLQCWHSDRLEWVGSGLPSRTGVDQKGTIRGYFWKGRFRLKAVIQKYST